MTGSAAARRRPAPPPRETVPPPRIPPDAARVVLIGAPSPLRSAVTQRLRTRTALLACLDKPGHLPGILSPVAGSRTRSELTDAAIVFLTVPQPPALASRLRHRYRAAALQAWFEQAAITARQRGAARVIVISTVFLLYADDQERSLGPGSGTEPTAETASAAAAERAARLFTSLGGDSIVLRLGWAYGRGEIITSRVLTAARRGWQLIDGGPGAWLAMIAQPDAARAVLPALTLPPGTYNVTDGCPVTQATLNARLAAALGKNLHPLDDPHWGRRGVLFGHSRRITDSTFRDLTGWHPQVPRAPESLAGMLSSLRKTQR